MGDLYASAIGTTVLQLKELPDLPEEFSGALCLFDLAQQVTEVEIRAELAQFGVIQRVEVERGAWPPAVVWFTTHEAALTAKGSATRLTHIAGGVDTLFNGREYDDRGWCAARIQPPHWPNLPSRHLLFCSQAPSPPFLSRLPPCAHARVRL